MTMEITRTRGFEVVSRCKDMEVKLPKRATSGSGAYDFFAIEDITIPPGTRYEAPSIIKTGIKAYMLPDEMLEINIRSSMAIKSKLMMVNSIGYIDSDYYSNETTDGEIMFAYYNLDSAPVQINKGDKIGQGKFSKVLFVDNEEEVTIKRKGGHGSTGR